jgi:hypothetical protein
MTIEQVCCVFFGVVIEGLTFVLGLLVGASLRRKEPSNEPTSPPGAARSHAARRGSVN